MIWYVCFLFSNTPFSTWWLLCTFNVVGWLSNTWYNLVALQHPRQFGVCFLNPSYIVHVASFMEQYEIPTTICGVSPQHLPISFSILPEKVEVWHVSTLSLRKTGWRNAPSSALQKKKRIKVLKVQEGGIFNLLQYQSFSKLKIYHCAR